MAMAVVVAMAGMMRPAISLACGAAVELAGEGMRCVNKRREFHHRGGAEARSGSTPDRQAHRQELSHTPPQPPLSNHPRGHPPARPPTCSLSTSGMQ